MRPLVNSVTSDLTFRREAPKAPAILAEIEDVVNPRNAVPGFVEPRFASLNHRFSQPKEPTMEGQHAMNPIADYDTPHWLDPGGIDIDTPWWWELEASNDASS